MKKILVVDDEVHIKNLLLQALEELEDKGVELLSASNGEEGLDLIMQERPQLVFLDVMMPKMNGFDVCKRITSDPELKETYIILLTAKGQDVDKKQGLDAGAREYMTKPFDPDEVLDKAKGILGMNL